MANNYGIITDLNEIREFIRDSTEVDEDNEWRVNLHLGEDVYVSTDEFPVKLTADNPFVCIKPGDFALLMTREYLTLPNDVMGFISIRFDYKEQGLINVSGFHVDPNFEKKLIFSVFNAGPKDIVLRKDDPIFMIFFQKLDKQCEKKHEGYSEIPAKMVNQIRGRSATLANNANRLDKIEFYVKVIGSFLVALVVMWIGFFLKSIQNP